MRVILWHAQSFLDFEQSELWCIIKYQLKPHSWGGSISTKYDGEIKYQKIILLSHLNHF